MLWGYSQLLVGEPCVATNQWHSAWSKRSSFRPGSPAGLTSFSTNLPGKKYIVRGRHHYILHTCLCVYLGHNTDPTSSNLRWSLWLQCIGANTCKPNDKIYSKLMKFYTTYPCLFLLIILVNWSIPPPCSASLWDFCNLWNERRRQFQCRTWEAHRLLWVDGGQWDVRLWKWPVDCRKELWIQRKECEPEKFWIGRRSVTD